MNRLSLNLLNSFVVFNEVGNMTEAAKALGITQPALSKQLVLLEKQLGRALFQLVGRKKMLTAFGKDLHLKIKDKVDNVQQLVHQTSQLHSDGVSSTIHVSGRREVLDRISNRLNFKGSLVFTQASNDQTIDAVLGLKSEIGITHTVPDSHELISKPLFKEDFQITIPKKMIRQKPSYGKNLFEDLLKLPCLGYRPEDEIIKEACGFSNVEVKSLRMIRATENYASLAEMVNAQMGWSVIPSHIGVSDKQVWIVKVPSKIIPTREFFILYRSELISQTWFKNLIAEIQSCF